MKKTFKLQIEGKNNDRVLEAIKHEVRKYAKRERNKQLPVGANYWRFDCKFGATAEVAEELRLADMNKHIDALVATGVESFYVEIIAAAAVRKPRETIEDSAEEGVAGYDEEDDLGE